MQRTRTAAVLLAGAALTLGAAGCGGNNTASTDATPAATASPSSGGMAAHLSGGETSLRLDATAKRVLDLAGVKLTAAGEATMRDGRLIFPISGGKLTTSPLGGSIEHAGGLRFTVGGQSVEATDLIVDPASKVATAEIAGRRVPLLSLEFGTPSRVPPKGGTQLEIPATASLIAPQALAQIGDKLGVSSLAKGIELGHIVVDAKA